MKLEPWHDTDPAPHDDAFGISTEAQRLPFHLSEITRFPLCEPTAMQKDELAHDTDVSESLRVPEADAGDVQRTPTSVTMPTKTGR